MTLSLSQPMEGNARRTSSGLTAHRIRLLEAPACVNCFNVRPSQAALMTPWNGMLYKLPRTWQTVLHPFCRRLHSSRPLLHAQSRLQARLGGPAVGLCGHHEQVNGEAERALRGLVDPVGDTTFLSFSLAVSSLFQPSRSVEFASSAGYTDWQWLGDCF